MMYMFFYFSLLKIWKTYNIKPSSYTVQFHTFVTEAHTFLTLCGFFMRRHFLMSISVVLTHPGWNKTHTSKNTLVQSQWRKFCSKYQLTQTELWAGWK